MYIICICYLKCPIYIYLYTLNDVIANNKFCYLKLIFLDFTNPILEWFTN